MQDRIIISTIALIVLLGAASVVAFTLPSAEHTATVSIESLATDRESYHSGDTMQITLDVSATGQIDGVFLKVEGIEDRYGRMRLSEERNVTLQKGSNSITMDYTMPVCSVCAGLNPGEYSITATLTKEGSLLGSATRSISIA